MLIHRRIQTRVWQISVAGLLTIPLIGCGSPTLTNRPATQPIALAEFALAPSMHNSAESAPQNDGTAERPDDASRSAASTSNEAARFGAGGSQARGPEQLSAESSPAGESRNLYVVESLVGQVNGRPIYAHEFFAPIADELAARGRTETQRRFEEIATAIVENQLRSIVLNELFLAEAESSLSEQEQMGLLAFMQNLQERTISQSGGVESVTRRRLLDEEGITLDEYLQMEKDRTLIEKLIRDRIAPRVIVSRRDVEREYRRRYDEFNPPAHAVLWRIVLSTESDAEQVERIGARIDSGESFKEIASSLGGRSGGEYGRFLLGPNGLADIELADSLRESLVGLQEGDTTDYIQIGSRTWWLHVAEIDQPPSQSLSDPEVQKYLISLLRERQFNIERARFIESLLDDGIYDELNSMRDRLIMIALLRYGP